MIGDESSLSGEPTPGRAKGRSGTLAEYSLEELIARWEEFFSEMGLESEIIGLTDRYPEGRSLKIRFEDLNRFDTDMSIHLLRQPLNVLTAGEEAIRRVVPPTEEPVEIHLRVQGVPRDSRIQIRDLRAKHLGRFVAVEGLVRKATEVRPMVVDALFQCLRCGTVIKEPQEGQSFHEPMECYEDQGGCKRSANATKFKLLGEASRFTDTQKIEVQEAPEGLRGGEEPQRLSAFTEDDLTGKINPGMRVILNGIMRSSQKGKPGARSTLFDILLDVNSIELEQVEFEEIEVTPEDVKRIEAEAADPDIYRKIVASIAPSIYGLSTEKEALALQLFSGVPKLMPDGRRIRGDIHLLLVGDPGCVVGDERITLGNGTIAKLERLGRGHLDPIRTQVRLGAGRYRNGWARRFHRYEKQPILEVVTETGKSIKGTYNHPLLVWNPSTRTSGWKRLDELRVGDRLRVTHSTKCWKQALVPTRWEEPRYFHKSWHVKVPQFVDEELAAIMGYVVGDGWVQERRVGCIVAEDEADLAPKLNRFFDHVFGVRPKREARRGKVSNYVVNRTPVARWLRGLAIKRIPDVVLQSRNSVAASFLRWLFEADGSCFAKGRGRTAVTLRSAEIELLRDVQILLLRWGIHSAILWGRAPRPHQHRGKEVRGGPSGSLVIRRTNSILRYARHVGFVSAKKTARLRDVVEYVKLRTRRWHAQNSERIVSVLPAGRATVFDIEVPGPQRFIANGIISHNTAKSELLSYMSRLSPRGIYATGKAASAAGLCVAGESLVETSTGPRRIEEIVQEQFESPDRRQPVETTVAAGFVGTFNGGVNSILKRLEAVWRLAPPPDLLEIHTESGGRLLLTPATKLMVKREREPRWIPAQFIRRGTIVATAAGGVAVDGGFAPGPMQWTRVSNVRVVPSNGRTSVYDLTVGDSHAFIANGFLVHNTAAAVRDEFGEGRWTLEAGALVLADKGLACLHPESQVFVDGLWTPVYSLFREDRAVTVGVGGQPVDISPLGRETLAVDPPTSTIVPRTASFLARRRYSGPMLSVTLDSGAVACLTPDHLVMDAEGGVWRELQTMAPGGTFWSVDPTSSAADITRAMTTGKGEVLLSSSTPSNNVSRSRIRQLSVEQYEGYVYDLRVPVGENFLCGGLLVHNCIDEIDKMNPQDRSAIHEAMEQQRVSVAKAGITAVLQARCAVLAAANPKFGRFDETKYIAEQIDLAPTLLSRFDIIFSLIDRPESERDRNLAEHIIRGHLVGEWLRRKEEGREVPEARPEVEEAYAPHFEPIFFRKYVAYAKRFSPVMTPESMETIKAKYLEIRRTGEAAGASVPITPRQLEAIIRLAEASARARLSQRVDPEDADRAVRITEYWMRRVAGEEGRFDIDIVQTGISQSQRDQIITLRDVINQLSEQSPAGSADYEDIVRSAGERGIPQVKVDQWLKRWAQEGDVYTPGKNKYKLVERL